MDSSPKHLHLDQQLCFALYKASRAVIRAYTPLLDPMGLTYAQYLVLLVLWEQDNLTVSEIGKQLALDSATLTPLLKKLESKKYVSRLRDKIDERVVRINLTKQGLAAREAASSFPQKIGCALGVDIASPKDVAKVGSLRTELEDIAASCSKSY